MKPDSTLAMQLLIEQIRERFPFDAPEAQVCQGPCAACSLKLLSYIEGEIEDWEARLAAGEKAGLADLSRLLKTSRRVARVLTRAGLMDAAAADDPQQT